MFSRARRRTQVCRASTRGAGAVANPVMYERTGHLLKVMILCHMISGCAYIYTPGWGEGAARWTTPPIPRCPRSLLKQTDFCPFTVQLLDWWHSDHFDTLQDYQLCLSAASGKIFNVTNTLTFSFISGLLIFRNNSTRF